MTGCHTSFMYYTPNILNRIYKELEDNVLTMVEIADKYNIDKSTVSRINNGEIHIDENRKYPIRKIYKNEHKEEKFCCDCGIKISYQSIRCNNCENKRRKEKAKNDKPISREELKQLIRTTPFIKIGKMFNVSDNAIRKWCKLYNLPFRVKDIKSYSNEEWNNI
jgi:transcriptional regulator with XRE-family HTH domain